MCCEARDIDEHIADVRAGTRQERGYVESAYDKINATNLQLETQEVRI